jgi:hypothetical protein
MIRVMCAILGLASATIGQEAGSPAATQAGESVPVTQPAVQSIIAL